MSKYNLLTILGPTASGKTALSSHLAARINGEVISADSRQVYRRMDLGTGKDREDYFVNGQLIPVHIIDIVDAGYRYNVFEFQQDFIKAYEDVRRRGKFPVLCGGSGLYLESVLNNYNLVGVPINEALRKSLAGKSLGELTDILKDIKPKLHNITDVVNEKRALRAIEIERFYQEHPGHEKPLPALKSLIIGVKHELLTRRKRITDRLQLRLNQGMIDEVNGLLSSGISPDDLMYYGLEYKFITLYLLGEITRNEMVEKLNTAIQQFAKRQMTWFRKMERQGTDIHWLDGEMPMDEKISMVMELLCNYRHMV